MALDFGLGALDIAGGDTSGGDVTGNVGLSPQGLGDFLVPQGMFTPLPSDTPTDTGPSGVDFASVGGPASDALTGNTFSGGISGLGGAGGDLSGVGDFTGPSPDISGVGDFTGPAYGGPSTDLGQPSEAASTAGGEITGAQDLSAQSVQQQDEQKKKDAGLSPLAKTGLLAAAPLGVAAINAARGPYTPPAAKTLQQIGVQQGAFGTQMLQMYQNGQIQPSAAARIAVDYAQNLSKIRQFYASTGQGNSTQAIQATAKATSDMTAQFAQYLDGELKAAMAAGGQSATAFAEVARLQLASDKAFSDALASAMSGMGKAVAIGMFGAKPTVSV